MRKKIGVLILLIVAAGIVLYFIFGYEEDSIKTFRDPATGVSFSYPGYLNVVANGNTIAIVHSVTFLRADPCDFKGDGIRKREFIDFNALISLKAGLIQDIILQTQGQETRLEDIFDNGSFRDAPGFIDEYKAGDKEGYRITLGAEGCGIRYYYFPLEENKILVVIQTFSPELTSLYGDYEKARALRGVILPNQAEKILQEIFTSIKVNSVK